VQEIAFFDVKRNEGALLYSRYIIDIIILISVMDSTTLVVNTT